MFFEGKGGVQDALRRIAKHLGELGIAYAVAGGMALLKHGYRRFTEDVDILVTRDGLKAIHHNLDGRGYLPPFIGSKNLRDTELGVKIEFLLTGDYPGDGKPKPLAFPDPSAVCTVDEGIKFVKLPTLVELKIASGMTNPERHKDLVDVEELIKVIGLPSEFSEQLNPFVREKYIELWRTTRPTAKRFIQIWRNKFLAVEAKSLEEMAVALEQAAVTLKAMLADGVVLDPKTGIADDYAYLVTTDPDIAKKYGMHDEAEFWAEAESAEKDHDAGQHTL
jgi:hypothetical protein